VKADWVLQASVL